MYNKALKSGKPTSGAHRTEVHDSDYIFHINQFKNGKKKIIGGKGTILYISKISIKYFTIWQDST